MTVSRLGLLSKADIPSLIEKDRDDRYSVTYQPLTKVLL